MQLGYTADNFFDADLVILTQCNMAYTWPAIYHFLTEARYNGTEIVVLAPDYNATALIADIHVPLRVASDSAFWLGVCRVIIDEGLHQPDFMREQTDLALLVRRDDGRYLRASDLNPIWPMEAPRDRELHLLATIYPERSRNKDLIGFDLQWGRRPELYASLVTS